MMLWDDVASILRLCMAVYNFPLAIPVIVRWRFYIVWKTRSACVMVGFVIFLCCKTIVSDNRSEFVFLNRNTCTW